MAERRPSRSERKRQAIRTAAYRCFRDHGYHETTVDSVCKTAGISKGSFYWHYDSKQEVFVDILETWTREVMDEVIQRFEAALEEEDPARALARSFRREVPRGRLIVPLWLEFNVLARREPEIQRALARFYRRSRAAIAEMLRPQVRGSLSEDELQSVAATIFGAYVGIVMQDLADPTWLDAVSVARHFMAVVGRAVYGLERTSLAPVRARSQAAAPTEAEPPGRADARDVAALVAAFDPRAAPLMARLRRLVVRAVPDATERVIAGWKVVGYERGGLFCYLKPTRDAEIQLGFYKGAQLDDPTGLLEGRGKRRRFVRIALDGAADEAALLALIEAAAALETPG